MTPPETLAELFVSLAPTAPGGCCRVLLSVPGNEPVQLGPHANPALARAELRAVRRFVAAAIRAGRGRAPTGPGRRRSGQARSSDTTGGVPCRPPP